MGLDQFGLGYLTNAIEGEGSVSISVNMNSGRKLFPYISVTNCNREWLERINGYLRQIDASGSIIKSHKRQMKPTHNVCWRLLIVGNRKVRIVLETIRPYLVVKARQADVALEYFRSRAANPLRYSPKDFELARAIHKSGRVSERFG